MATGCFLQALQQLTGVNFIFYYGTSFFKNSGISDSFVVSMITSAVNVASTFPGLYMVETWGRRNLLLFGAAGMVSKLTEEKGAFNQVAARSCLLQRDKIGAHEARQPLSNVLLFA